jgi:hypothetical protein
MDTPDTGSLDEFYEKVGTEKVAEKKRSRSPLADLTNEVADESKGAKKPEPGKLCQYALFGTGYMATTATIQSLPSGCYKPHISNLGVWLDPINLITDSLIQFPDTKSDSIIAEVEKFWELKRKFKEFGFSHKRGFLLWGPPGSGKTCTVAILVKKMVSKGGLVLIAESPDLLGYILSQVRSIEPQREMIEIWEDLDAVIERFGESEVLSILDGESQIDNIVFIATTNYPEKLDSRITNRPSRFDRIEKIDTPNDEARRMYLEAKIQTTFSPDGIDLVAETKGMSIAHLRELIVGVWCQGNSATDVLSRLKKMKVKPNSAHSGSPIGFSTS